MQPTTRAKRAVCPQVPPQPSPRHRRSGAPALAALAILTLAILTLATLACSTGPAAPLAADGHVDLSGVWIVNGSPDLPSDPAYTTAAQAQWEERKGDLTGLDPATYCLPNGVVRVTDLPYKIVQTPQLVVILSEGNTHSFRRLFLDGRGHDLDIEPESWTGNSIASWEGEGAGATLVVDTIGFNDRTWLDSTGKPHSAQMHVVERYRRPDLNTLEVEYTVEDPEALTEPYTFTRSFLLQPDREIEEQFCTDNTGHLTGE